MKTRGSRPSSSLLRELVADPLLDKYTVKGAPKELIAYRPQPRQETLIKAVGLWDWWNGGGMESRTAPMARTIGYGGAAYGGKTYGILGTAALCAWAFPGAQMAFFRRTYTEMEGPGAVMGEAHEIFPLAGGEKRDGGRMWEWENGSKFFFRHCEHENDVYKYQSQQMDIFFADEATHFSWTMIDYLLTRNRATTDSIIRPFACLFSNPGNVGHSWYMQVFDLDKEGGVTGMKRWEDRGAAIETYNPNEKLSSVFFIPAYLEDNVIGNKRDPDYEKTLQARHPDTYEALRFGNWEVFTGQAFREFRQGKHVVAPFEIPGHWPKWRAVDKGWSHPFVCLWMTRNPATKRTYIYREIAGSEITDEQQAYLIAMNTPVTENITITFATPDFWIAKNFGSYVKTSAEEYGENGIPLIRGNADRKLGKQMVHNYLAEGSDGNPKLQIFSNCSTLINILPKLVRDGEDVKKQDGDDPYDCLKIGLTNVSMFITPGKKDEKDHYQRDEWKMVNNML